MPRAPETAGARRRKKQEDGVVLLLILVLILLTIASVASFSRTTVLEVLSARQRDARAHAELLARSGIGIATRALLDDRFLADDLLSNALETPRDPWRILSRTPIELPDDLGRLRIMIEDSGSKISFNALRDEAGEARVDSRSFLVAALERIIEKMPGRDEDKPYDPEELADALLDWVDGDDQTRLGDDEQAFYELQGAESGPVDRPLFSLDELQAVPGMDDLLLEALKLYFTPYPLFPDIARSGVNLNTAPAHILGLIFRGTAQEKQLLGNDEVFRILQAREEGTIFCAPDYSEDCTPFSELTGFVGESVFPPLQYESHVFEIRSVAEFAEARACITAVIDRSDVEDPRTLFYRVGCA